ncbi:phytanoyl-CoA dioxygenase family protein [Leptospira sp. 'Mane']|uniref:phytanoyl-CoA dioxygenase family protein n=1 Tax=Leptospira sp. 'Mane' TaxID=3387407 RepID=UPI00398B4C5A
MQDVYQNFRENGYYLFRNFFKEDELNGFYKILQRADNEWQKTNFRDSYVNSNYLTSTRYCKEKEDRIRFFAFISQNKILEIAKVLIQDHPYFLNTQIFYNPKEISKSPYWHRDVQYLGVPEEEQKNIILKDSVLHFRIPFKDDPGLHFIPGSHSRWDTEEERTVRLELNGHKNNEEISNSVKIPHAKGDLLVFSAHIIHKGDYSKERFSFDLLLTDFPEKENTIISFLHFPEQEISDRLENPGLFEFTKETIGEI